jgi:hypothetical protein
MNAYTQRFSGAGKNIGAGIAGGCAQLRSSPQSRIWASKIMVLLTDGTQNTGTEPMLAAAHAANENVTIYVVTFSDEAEQSQMQSVAEITHGSHYHANNLTELINAFEHIVASLPTLLIE